MRCVFAMLLCVLTGSALAELKLAPFPFATIVEQGEEISRPRDFVLSAVESIRRETSIERMVTVAAQRRWITYEVPIDTDPAKLKAHYAEQLGVQSGTQSRTKLLFQCEGRDCGRSNTWANQIFGQALLYGRDQEQVYFAAQVEDQLVAVYLIKRGNRRQYAHVEVWLPDVMPQLGLAITDASQWQEWLAGFARTGFAEIPQVQPQANGELNRAALDALASLAMNIPDSLRTNLYLVCHLYPTASRGSSAVAAEVAVGVAQSIAAATRCAEDATAVFAEAGTTVTPQGIGPLAPNQSRARSRLVLVAPSRLTR
jgi:hypothetical protein